MAVSSLTREQQIQLDQITKILPDDVVAGMSRHELKIYRELLTARDQAEESFVSQNAALPAKAQAALAIGEEEQIPDDLKPPPSATPEPIKVESQIPDPSDTDGDETDIPSPTYDPAEMEAWKQKAQELQDRYRNLQSAVSPTQQDAATLRKKLKAADQTVEQIRQEMDERFSRIEKLLTERQQPQVQAPSEPDPLDGLDEVDPDMARRLRALKSQLTGQLAEPLKKLKEDLDRREEKSREDAQRNYQAQHDQAVRGMVPDFEDLVYNPANAEVLKEWLKVQPPAIQTVLLAPYNHTPQDVAYVFSQFKASRRGKPAAKKPSLGDLASNMKLAPVTPLNEIPSGQDLLTDAQMNSIDLLMRKAMEKGEDPSIWVDRYERTLLAKQKATPNRK